MKKESTQVLIERMQQDLQQQIARTNEILELPERILSQRTEPGPWSVVEVYEHMGLSSGHYLVRAEKIYADPDSGVRLDPTYTQGTMGRFFTEGLRPSTEGRIGWKMRTMGMFEPRPEKCLGTAPLERFVKMCERFLAILDVARTRGIEGAKITSTLGPIIRFKVGDALLFPIAHQQRHMLQVERTLIAVGAASTAQEV